MTAMKPWRHFALATYCQATYPYRVWQSRGLRRLGRTPIGVVIFHRIADDEANDWTTPTATFRDAIHWLSDHFEMISLSEAQRRIRAESNREPSLCITFDDGYEVNCREALPLLIERRIPCTYFVTTGPALTGTPFEHDLVMGNYFRPNSIDQLKEVAAAGIEIGAHGRTHPDFARITDEDVLFDELVTARDDLQAAVGVPIRYFAFPFGEHKNLSAQAFHMAREAGFEGVLSAYGGYNYAGDDPFHLQRKGVDGPLVRIKNWATIDPFRHRGIPRFNYGTRPAAPLAAVGASA
jgi:peptidoglycan/xylan/chitin deacetylase (PgdA/CDA1 family)